MDTLKGNLIIASPTLEDPNFARTVILVTEHSDEGAMGVVLNRPSHAVVEEAATRVSFVDGSEAGGGIFGRRRRGKAYEDLVAARAELLDESGDSESH